MEDARRRRAPQKWRGVSKGLIEDVDHYEVVQGVSVRGATEKDVLRDPATGIVYVAKLGRRNNDLEVMTEYAIFLVGRALGANVANGRIARYQGRLRFLSQYFLDTQGDDELVHGLQLFRELYDEKLVTEVLKDEAREQEMFSVQAVEAVLRDRYRGDDDDIFAGFVAMLAHDAVIGVQDRHHENWGIIVQREVGAPPPRFAPLFDSARGLFCNETDADILKYTSSDGARRLEGYVARSRPLVGFAGLGPIQGRRYVTHDQLLAAVFRRYPSHRERITSTVDALDPQSIAEVLVRELPGLCSRPRAELIAGCLERRQDLVRRAIAEQSS